MAYLHAMSAAPRRTKPQGAYLGKESSLQSSAIRLIRTIASSYGVPPEMVVHIPNGRNAGSVRMGGFWRTQGVVSGFPDIMMFKKEPVDTHFKRGTWPYSGLAIELKVFPNKPSGDQLRIHEMLRLAGWRVEVCYGLDEVERITLSYLAADK